MILLAAFVAAAGATGGIPSAFHGLWVRDGGRCTAGLQMEGMLTVEPLRMVHGEEFMAVTAIRRVSRVRVGIDTNNVANDEERWTSTTLLTLSDRGRSLRYEGTRINGKLLPSRATETYRRCR